jgi:hypothetical protein
MDASKRADWERKFRDAVQPRVDEPVLAVSLFYRTGGYAALALGPFSGIAALVASGVGRRRAAGLPSTFLIAVTPTRLHAFKCATSHAAVKVRHEVAVWDRAGLVVLAEEMSVNTRVTIELPNGLKVVCSTGKDPLSQAVVYAMQHPVGVPVAATA